jgi:coatomer subunit beta'
MGVALIFILSKIFWSTTGTLVAVVSEDSFYILKFDRDAYTAKLEEGVEITDEGVEEAFDVVAEISDRCVMLIVYIIPN